MKNHPIPITFEPKPSDKVLELNQVLPINDSSGKIVDIFIPILSRINLVDAESRNIQIELPSERVIEYDQLLLKVYKCSYISALLARKIGEIYEMIKNENSVENEISFLEKLSSLQESIQNNVLLNMGSNTLKFKYERERFNNRLEAFFFRGIIFKRGVPCIIEGDNKLLLRIQKGNELTKYSYYSLTEDILKSYFKEYLELNQILVDLETNYKSFRSLDFE